MQDKKSDHAIRSKDAFVGFSDKDPDLVYWDSEELRILAEKRPYSPPKPDQAQDFQLPPSVMMEENGGGSVHWEEWINEAAFEEDSMSAKEMNIDQVSSLIHGREGDFGSSHGWTEAEGSTTFNGDTVRDNKQSVKDLPEVPVSLDLPSYASGLFRRVSPIDQKVILPEATNHVDPNAPNHMSQAVSEVSPSDNTSTGKDLQTANDAQDQEVKVRDNDEAESAEPSTPIADKPRKPKPKTVEPVIHTDRAESIVAIERVPADSRNPDQPPRSDEPGASWEKDANGNWRKMWLIEKIIDSRRRSRKNLWYQVKWQGSDAPEYTTWEPLAGVKECTSFLADFHAMNPSKPFTKIHHPNYPEFQRPEGWISPVSRRPRRVKAESPEL